MDKVQLNERKVRETYNGRHRPDPDPDLRRVTLVAFPAQGDAFWDILDSLCERVEALLGHWRDLEWVQPCNPRIRHGTIIGLEAHIRRVGDGQEAVNVNLKERLKGAIRDRDIPAMNMSEVVRYCGALPFPMCLKFGGFQPGQLNPYAGPSQWRQPYYRSFSIGLGGLMVAMGWPVNDEGTFLPTLLGIRKAFERSLAVHKYHQSSLSIDNDLFVLIAETTTKPWDEGSEKQREAFFEDLARTQEQIRQYMAINPVRVTLSEDHCYVVKYEKPSLEGELRRIRLSELNEQVLKDLYFA